MAQHRVLSGFHLSLGYTLVYLSLIVLIPLSAVFIKTFSLSFAEFWEIISSPRMIASYKLTFGASLGAALINAVFGLIFAWVLVRYDFFGKKLVDALVDLPFALPTAVAGIALTAIYSGNGWLGQYLEPLGIKVAFTPLGVLVALVFIGLPFVVRTVQPVLQDLETELEEAAAIDGADANQTFWQIVIPLAAPQLAVTFFLGFIGHWQEFVLTWLFLSQPKDYTLAMTLYNMTGQYANSIPWNRFAAMAVIVALPVAVVYIALQKQIVGGLTSGSVKG